MPEQTKIQFRVGSLIAQLLDTPQNRSWLTDDLDIRIQEPLVLCSPDEGQEHSTTDLRTFIQLTEALRSFEVLALFAYLSALPGSGAGERQTVASNIMNALPVTPINIESSIGDQDLVEYLGLDQAIRSFEIVALRRYTKQGVDKAELAGHIIDSVEDFYEDAIGLVDGVVSDCSPLCTSLTQCVMCKIEKVQVEEPQP
jgi:hypothetical protein